MSRTQIRSQKNDITGNEERVERSWNAALSNRTEGGDGEYQSSSFTRSQGNNGDHENNKHSFSINSDKAPLLNPTEVGALEKSGCGGKECPEKIKVCVFVVILIILTALTALIVHLEATNSANDCRSLSSPLHGKSTCSREKDKIKTKKCRFTCDDPYKLVGNEEVTCNSGNWNSLAPTCEKECSSLPKVSKCEISCTNGYFVNSVCTFKCLDNHVIQGDNALTCFNDSNWSYPEPSCVCLKCQLGDKCQYTTSWNVIAAALEEIVVYTTMTVNYGGHAFHCKVHLHGISKWSASCTDNDTGTKHSCNNHSHGFGNPATAGKSAAAELIKDLVKQLKYPKPCDPQDLPNEC